MAQPTRGFRKRDSALIISSEVRATLDLVPRSPSCYPHSETCRLMWRTKFLLANGRELIRSSPAFRVAESSNGNSTRLRTWRRLSLLLVSNTRDVGQSLPPPACQPHSRLRSRAGL